MKKLLALATVAGTAAMTLTACGGGATKGFVMLITAEGSKTDGTFNESSWKGMEKANELLLEDLTIDAIETKSGEESKLKESLLSAIEKGAETMILPGFNQAHKSLHDIANDYSSRNFLVLDADGYFGDAGFVANSSVASGNITSALYAVEQAAFLAGFAVQKSRNAETKYGIWGGVAYPSVYSFMAGFKQGVEHAVHAGYSTATFLTPKDSPKADDYYVGNFNAGGGTAMANVYLGKGADILLPVAGPQTKDAIDATKAHATNKTAKIVGVDVDAKGLYADDASMIITSILKRLDTTVYNYLKAVYEDETIPGLTLGKVYTGNLNNGGVGITDIAGVTIGNEDSETTSAKLAKACVLDYAACE